LVWCCDGWRENEVNCCCFCLLGFEVDVEEIGNEDVGIVLGSTGARGKNDEVAAAVFVASDDDGEGEDDDEVEAKEVIEGANTERKGEISPPPPPPPDTDEDDDDDEDVDVDVDVDEFCWAGNAGGGK
jgi:hypothetical protein